MLDLSGVFDIEYTALKMLVAAERARGDGITLWLAALNPAVLALIQRSPLGERSAGADVLHGSTGGGTLLQHAGCPKLGATEPRATARNRESSSPEDDTEEHVQANPKDTRRPERAQKERDADEESEDGEGKQEAQAQGYEGELREAAGRAV